MAQSMSIQSGMGSVIIICVNKFPKKTRAEILRKVVDIEKKSMVEYISYKNK